MIPPRAPIGDKATHGRSADCINAAREATAEVHATALSKDRLLPDTARPTPALPAPSDRPLRQAMMRGAARGCPNCGAKTLFEGYLKVRDHCPSCGQEFFHHRADDGPAYLTILVVGHLMAPFIHIVYSKFRPEPLVMAIMFSIGCVALSLYLLPRIKGALIGFQWAKRMHGFGGKA